MRPLALLILLALTACGAAGPPVAPTAMQPAVQPGISMSGSATMGIARDGGT